MGGFSMFAENDEHTNQNATPPPSTEEQELIRLNTQIAQKQLQNMDQLQPFQKQLLEASMADLQRQSKDAATLDAAISPEDRAAFQKAEFDRAKRLGPLQDELLQMQLETARQGGRATPEQLADIRAAADAGIEAGTADIDRSTTRGIGLISDELANSRGLRLTDSPIMAEAGQLVAGSEELKAGLIKNLRAGEATARLNFPLAASQVSSGINLSTQGVAESARNFQAELRNRAFQNRMALTGTAASSGIGLASIGGGTGVGTLSTLTGNRNVNLRTDYEGSKIGNKLSLGTFGM